MDFTNTRERRIVGLDRIELRKNDAGVKILEGHAAVFNKDSEPMWGFVERVAPGTFSRAIKEDDVRALFNHDANYILGRRTAETLRLSEDSTGLAFEVDLPDTTVARDLEVSVSRRDVTQCSFSFRTIKDAWEYKEDGSVIRTLQEVELYDVGPVTFPAYPDTDVAMRSVMTAIAEEGKRRLTKQIEDASPKQIPLALRKKQLAALEAMV